MNAPADPSAEAKPSVAAAVIAALVPLGATGAALLVLQLTTDGGVMRMIDEAGVLGVLVVASTLLFTLVNGALALLAGLGRRVPAAIGAALSMTPWMLALLGVQIGLRNVMRAVAACDPSSRAAMLARGTSELDAGRALGTWLSAALAIGLALALAVAALGQRATDRRPLLGAIGLALALPLLGGAAWAFVAQLHGLAATAALAGIGALVALVLAFAASGSSPNGRAAALSASASALVAAGWIASTTSAAAAATRSLFYAASSAAPEERAQLMATGLVEEQVASMLGWIGGAALVLAAIACTAWSAARARPSAGRIAGGVALSLVLVGGVSIDRIAAAAVGAEIDGAGGTPWADVAGFTPIVLPDWTDGAAETTPFVLSVNGLAQPTAIGNQELATPAGHARLVALFEDAIRVQVGDEEVPEWLLVATDDEPAPEPTVSVWPTISLAADARVDVETLRAVLRAADEAHAHSVTLVGLAEHAHPITTHGRLVEGVTTPTSGVTIMLERAVPSDAPAQDAVLWHATLGASSTGTLAPRAGDPHAPAPFGPDARTPGGFDGAPTIFAYLALGPDARPETIALAVAAIDQNGRQSVLCTGAIPGHPEQPHAALP